MRRGGWCVGTGFCCPRKATLLIYRAYRFLCQVDFGSPMHEKACSVLLGSVAWGKQSALGLLIALLSFLPCRYTPIGMPAAPYSTAHRFHVISRESCPPWRAQLGRPQASKTLHPFSYRLDSIRLGSVPIRLVLTQLGRFGLVRLCYVLCRLVPFGSIQLISVCLGLVRFGSVRCGDSC